ncbi:MAG TPA: hypothetical protein VMM35_02845 [Longimicrobiales bacterium]|nr:hypothetical protein [Longimicrobiales bacterium]
MEELIFFAVIIFFSIIESIARRRKKQSGQSLPREWEPEDEPGWQVERPAPASRRTPAPTYDADASYDEIELDEATRSREAPRSGSEGMIPKDLWEEISGLARDRMGELEARPEPPAPVPAPKVPPATASGRAAWGKRTPRVGQQHHIHLAHAEYGTDPSSRAPSMQDAMDPLARRLSADVRAVRKSLRGGRHALRQAVILQEVLGPPASMHPESFLE